MQHLGAPTPLPESGARIEALRHGYVPMDLLNSLKAGEYQFLNDWICAALQTSARTHRLSTDPSRNTSPRASRETDLSHVAWREACDNMRRALTYLGLDSTDPRAPVHSALARQLDIYASYISCYHVSGYNWPALQLFDRAIRMHKAQDPALDLSRVERF